MNSKNASIVLLSSKSSPSPNNSVAVLFQVNMAVAGELANRVLGYIKQIQPEYLVELYSGSGIFSILAAECLPSLHCTGVELDGEAVRTAAVNAEEHGVADRCRFYSDDAACFRIGR